ncbi:hypothetical protein [Streptomyces sp. ISL-44]|nr:hypothetical protein [Streptomyces sp. ISL-44]
MRNIPERPRRAVAVLAGLLASALVGVLSLVTAVPGSAATAMCAS